MNTAEIAEPCLARLEVNRLNSGAWSGSQAGSKATDAVR